MEGKRSINSLFFAWWYVELCHRLLLFTKQFFLYLADLFSVALCVKTLFVPWKRDQISYEGLTLQDKFQVAILNLVSRLFGATIKTFTLVTYLLVTAVCALFAVLVFLLWFIYPLLLISLVVIGLKILFLG